MRSAPSHVLAADPPRRLDQHTPAILQRPDTQWPLVNREDIRRQGDRIESHVTGHGHRDAVVETRPCKDACPGFQGVEML